MSLFIGYNRKPPGFVENPTLNKRDRMMWARGVLWLQSLRREVSPEYLYSVFSRPSVCAGRMSWLKVSVAKETFPVTRDLGSRTGAPSVHTWFWKNLTAHQQCRWQHSKSNVEQPRANRSSDDIVEAQVAYMGAKKCYIRLDRSDPTVHLAYVSASVWRNKETSKIVVGDNVVVKRIESQVPGDETPNFRVLERLPRFNLFQRSNEDGDRVKELAANVDQLVVVCSFGLPPFSSIVLDRVLVAALHAKISPVIVLNKLDLVSESEFQAISSTYESANFLVLGTSTVDGRGLEKLREALDGKTSALYGITGAGKSSLVNAIANLSIRTGEVSEAIRSGRHTTSSSRLYALSPTTAIIDTPGVRSFRPHGLEPRDVVDGFPEFAVVAHNCDVGSRCLHLHEPVQACAVKRAVRDGTVAAQRYTSFAHMLLEMEDAM